MLPSRRNLADHGRPTHQQEAKILFLFAETKSTAAKQKTVQTLLEIPAKKTP
jgi:hypothetical protein